MLCWLYNNFNYAVQLPLNLLTKAAHSGDCNPGCKTVKLSIPAAYPRRLDPRLLGEEDLCRACRLDPRLLGEVGDLCRGGIRDRT